MTDAEVIAAAERVGWGVAAICRELGKPGSGSLERRIRALKRQASDAGKPQGAPATMLTVDLPPLAGLTDAELVEHLKLRYARHAARADALKCVGVSVSDSLPIGLLAFGDLHLDDPGTNIAMIEAHANLVRATPGMWGITPGDFLNNWVGRLVRLYGVQNVTQAEGWQLVRWFFDLVRDWAAVVLGNHDVWTGPGSPMEWISRMAGVWAEKHEVRLAFRFPNEREVFAHMRHDFPGRSIYNDTHGLLRDAMFGHRDHLKIAGHTHVSGYQVTADPTNGRAIHLVRVKGYKDADEYPVERGLHEKNLGPSALIVVDPTLPDTHPDQVHVWRDPAEGADFLTFARKRRSRVTVPGKKARAA